MENEQLIDILNEILEEQKAMHSAHLKAIEKIQNLQIKIEEVAEILKNQKPIPPKVDTSAFQEVVMKGFREMNSWIQIILDKKQSNNLKIFFESDAKKWAVILLVALTFLTYSYLWAIRK